MTTELSQIANELRAEVIELCCRAQTPHLASQLSCMDILVAAYWNVLKIDPAKSNDLNRDRLIFSKGHAVPALYVTLCRRGFFSRDLIDAYAKEGAALPEQPSPGCAPGVELATGSLGHGLPVGVGIAMANRIAKRDARVFVLSSDGECNEGSVWEAAMLAGAQKLNRLCVIVDYNKWQATGRSQEILAIEPFRDKWEAFGWEAYEINGHDINEISSNMKRSPTESGKPLALVAHTTKGKGVSFMEDDNNWHYLIPKPEHLEKARIELGVKK